MDPRSAGSLAPPPPAPILELREATALNVAAQKRTAAAEKAAEKAAEAGAFDADAAVGAQFSVVALGTGKEAPAAGGPAPAAGTGFVAALSAKFAGAGKTGSAAGTGSAAVETVASFL